MKEDEEEEKKKRKKKRRKQEEQAKQGKACFHFVYFSTLLLFAVTVALAFFSLSLSLSLIAMVTTAETVVDGEVSSIRARRH